MKKNPPREAPSIPEEENEGYDVCCGGIKPFLLPETEEEDMADTEENR